ncbi:hypothetical protein MPTK1_Vg01180 [Marchantia polymorpha subsp. ruderalis]|uniref:RING-type domain-containing protein n=2 Tax=Marchantia polymorpha TaxID=3197 RepID=A0A2R6VWZ0_MARPO|nr:hypothetical protein MARPO_YA0004 [Marchantia polymorpha]BBN20661.1 hypothetical protein Mp_Vg01180 [Marchantia polymorpha subsp. ruderalis]|eukprot:PTQ26113.1 hypothetical protein MARPO_YA0004 [Marchantia polymorpha]
MTTSNIRVSTVEYHCMQRNYSAKSNVQTPHLDRNASCGPISSRDLQQSQSTPHDSKSECFHSKDASKRKRVNRTAKLKQCKLDARREQWLSQGNHPRGKHEDQDGNDDLGLKSNVEGSPRIYDVKGFSMKSNDPVASDSLDLEQICTEADENGAESSSGKQLVVSKSPVKQIMSIRWDGSKNLQPPDLNRLKDQCKDKDLRFHGIAQDDDTVEVQGKSLMHKCCLTDRKTSTNTVHLIPLNSSLESKGLETGRKGTVVLTDERTDRMNLRSRPEVEISVPIDLKQDRGIPCRACSEGDFSPTQSTSSSASSGYTGSSSGENGGSHSHDAEDDWEAVADAIYMQGAACKSGDAHKPLHVEKDMSIEKKGVCSGTTDLQKGALKPEYKYKAGMLGGRMRGMGGRAWRPDDAARPPTLPRLSKQHSFPLQATPSTWGCDQRLHGSNLWGPPPAPLYCPICTEELDMTDSSFVPCSCGFRLCLFCHHRIAAEDGRCPGCRKTYNTDVAMKLSRSSSVWLRV